MIIKTSSAPINTETHKRAIWFLTKIPFQLQLCCIPFEQLFGSSILQMSISKQTSQLPEAAHNQDIGWLKWKCLIVFFFLKSRFFWTSSSLLPTVAQSQHSNKMWCSILVLGYWHRANRFGSHKPNRLRWSELSVQFVEHRMRSTGVDTRMKDKLGIFFFQIIFLQDSYVIRSHHSTFLCPTVDSLYAASPLLCLINNLQA